MATDCYLIAMCRPFACRFGNHWQPLAEADDIGQDERDHFESRSKKETGRESENWWKGVKRKINKNLVSISQCLEASWKCRHAPPTAQLTICLAPTPSQQLPLIHLKALLTTKRHRNQPELAVVVPPRPPSQVQVWRMMWNERLGRKREVGVPAGSGWWRQTADRLACISWIFLVLSSSLRVCFEVGCWGCNIAKITS